MSPSIQLQQPLPSSSLQPHSLPSSGYIATTWFSRTITNGSVSRSSHMAFAKVEMNPLVLSPYHSTYFSFTTTLFHYCASIAFSHTLSPNISPSLDSHPIFHTSSRPFVTINLENPQYHSLTQLTLDHITENLNRPCVQPFFFAQSLIFPSKNPNTMRLLPISTPHKTPRSHSPLLTCITNP